MPSSVRTTWPPCQYGGAVARVLHRELGLSDEEAATIASILGRAPNHLELAMYAVMWSEHCSYKSSRLHLRRLPTDGPRVLVGPGENAGVIDAGGGLAVAVRIESHNHPSAIEPYQGAATGVGGILRDIFTMGARPIALMDPLRMGPLEDPRSRWVFDGVVRGIAGYGNAVGVPTVGGEVVLDETYASNPLVNVLCLGIMPASRLVLARASGAGNLVLLLGASTGRDGIGGVSVLASAGFGTDPTPGAAPTEGAAPTNAAASKDAAPRAPSGEELAKRPSVQVGDPFEEKRLIEACLELLESGLLVGLQDLGGAGLTCATSETASRAGMGMDLNVAAVPRREPGMAAFEVMTSESQERMLGVVRPDDLPEVLEVCRRWEVRAAVVGRVTDGGRLRVLEGWEGPVLADMPAASLAEQGPVYDRPARPPADVDGRRADDPRRLEPPADCGADLVRLLADPSWVWSQYDHQLFLNTVGPPGGDAAVLRLAAPGVPDTGRGLALSTDGNANWCALDPRLGAAMTVAESVLNVACVGAKAVALVNCLNLGNPEHPEVMWQLSEIVDGLSDACRALGLPVVGGNVSFYNETAGRDIDPTPVVGVVGLIDRLAHPPPGPHLAEGAELILLGRSEANLAGSRWATTVCRHRGGVLPRLDLGGHRTLCRLVAGWVGAQLAGEGGPVAGLHDVSSGGLGVTLAEMAAGSGVGLVVGEVDGHTELFGESPSRVVICTRDPARVIEGAKAAGVPWRRLGHTGGDRVVIADLVDLPLEGVRSAWHDAIPAALAAHPAGPGTARPSATG
jgi:phosphoribosylformylglycinamidine synthase II